MLPRSIAHVLSRSGRSLRIPTISRAAHAFTPMTMGLSHSRAFGSSRALWSDGAAEDNKINTNSQVGEYGADPDVRYTDNHEWIALHKDGVAFVGITKYAADALGDTTFVEVVDPETEIQAKDSIGSVESVKSASDLYSPVSGTLIEQNQEVIDNPSLVNKDPMGAAWFAKLQVKDKGELEDLMTFEKYDEFLKEDH